MLWKIDKMQNWGSKDELDTFYALWICRTDKNVIPSKKIPLCYRVGGSTVKEYWFLNGSTTCPLSSYSSSVMMYSHNWPATWGQRSLRWHHHKFVAMVTHGSIKGGVFNVGPDNSWRGNGHSDTLVKPAIVDVSMEEETGLSLYVLEMREEGERERGRGEGGEREGRERERER